MDSLINSITEQIINDIELEIRENKRIYKVLTSSKICFYVFANKKYHWLMDYLLINSAMSAHEYKLLTKEEFINEYTKRGLRL